MCSFGACHSGANGDFEAARRLERAESDKASYLGISRFQAYVPPSVMLGNLHPTLRHTAWGKPTKKQISERHISKSPMASTKTFQDTAASSLPLHPQISQRRSVAAWGRNKLRLDTLRPIPHHSMCSPSVSIHLSSFIASIGVYLNHYDSYPSPSTSTLWQTVQMHKPPSLASTVLWSVTL